MIGLTGNIACGKSTVLRLLESLGATAVDADRLAHEALDPNGPAYSSVVSAWGGAILAPSGEVDRRRLGQIVFSDPAALERLEAMIHPLVIQQVAGLIHTADAPLVIDAVKLIESGIARMCDEVWVVACSKEEQLRRLLRRDGFTEDEALLRIQAQSPQDEKLVAADLVIYNDGSLEDTRLQVVEAWRRATGRHVAPQEP